ncbi:hypothetical protein BT96DRAFT_739387, partial [Gymnopus androsaceus JB14]
RMYIGQVLDIYKKGQNSRHGSVHEATELSGLSYLSLRVFLPLRLPAMKNSDSDSGSDDEDASYPQFLCQLAGCKFHLHTHALVANMLYHLG